MDSTVLVVLGGIATALITAIGGIAVAIITSNKEVKNTANSAVKHTYEQRIAFRDEQLAERDRDLAHCKKALARCRSRRGGSGEQQHE